jgi:hypothetical protein
MALPYSFKQSVHVCNIDAHILNTVDLFHVAQSLFSTYFKRVPHWCISCSTKLARSKLTKFWCVPWRMEIMAQSEGKGGLFLPLRMTALALESISKWRQRDLIVATSDGFHIRIKFVFSSNGCFYLVWIVLLIHSKSWHVYIWIFAP